MWKEGSRVMVGVSGGKDSMLTLHVLSAIREKENIEVAAFHLDLSIPDYSSPSLDTIRKYTEDNDVPLFTYSLSKEWGMSLGEIAETLGRKPCSLCGLLKRYYLLKTAVKEGFDVVATGHNMDDILSFFLYNAATGGKRYFPSLLPKVKTIVGVIKVRPLYYLDENRIRKEVEALQVPYFPGKCPFSSMAPTGKIRKFLQEMEEERPGFKKTLLKFFLDVARQTPAEKPGKCKICGMPSSGEVCSVCKIKMKLGLDPKKLF